MAKSFFSLSDLIDSLGEPHDDDGTDYSRFTTPTELHWGNWVYCNGELLNGDEFVIKAPIMQHVWKARTWHLSPKDQVDLLKAIMSLSMQGVFGPRL